MYPLLSLHRMVMALHLLVMAPFALRCRAALGSNTSSIDVFNAVSSFDLHTLQQQRSDVVLESTKQHVAHNCS